MKTTMWPRVVVRFKLYDASEEKYVNHKANKFFVAFFTVGVFSKSNPCQCLVVAQMPDYCSWLRKSQAPNKSVSNWPALCQHMVPGSYWAQHWDSCPPQHSASEQRGHPCASCMRPPLLGLTTASSFPLGLLVHTLGDKPPKPAWPLNF